MSTALVCIALLGLLLFGLGFAVSLLRGRTNTLVGSSGDPADSLHKLVRAHGNTAEYSAMLAILIFLVGTRSPASWALWC
ncbi:MAG: MAPEG family protein, partial [Deltaproteobacteria bacterium]|nr:MAPEG family protein [Deltaproteobacteria bacterium]